MHFIDTLITSHVVMPWVVLLVGFAGLAKCAGLFVDSSVALAKRFKIPKLVIGIVLVSLATTAPELSVSMSSAIRGKPEMALGNAIGSVICDDGLAMAACGIFSASAIPVIPHVLRTSGAFLIGIEILVFVFVLADQTLSRGEGAILVLLFLGYLGFLFHQHKTGRFVDDHEAEEDDPSAASGPLGIFLKFGIALVGIIFFSEIVISCAEEVARMFGISEAAIALTLVALGTSVPEVATCIVAARKGQGALAVGNIIGADIMNICWVAGASSLVNSLTLARRDIYFMFPAMFIVVGVMLLLLRKGYTLTRGKGWVLLALYVLYLTSFVFFFAPPAP